MADRQYYEISPGYGAPGIADARRKLLEEVAAAAGIVFKLRDGTRIWYTVRRTDIGIIVDFNGRTHLQIDLWDHFQRRHYGFEPKWHFAHSTGGDFFGTADLVSIERYRLHAMKILDAVKVVVARVTLVQIT